jgi:hypothetical protein
MQILDSSGSECGVMELLCEHLKNFVSGKEEISDQINNYLLHN